MIRLKDISDEIGLKDKRAVWGPLNACRLMTGKKFHIYTKRDEAIYLVCIQSNGFPEKIFELNESTSMHLGTSSFDFIKAILQCESRSVILIHNHPNSNSSPSFTDMIFTWKLNKALRCCGITLLDHIIIGYKSCSSIMRLLNPKMNLKFFTDTRNTRLTRQSMIFSGYDFR